MLSRLAVALVHHPVLNRRGEVVATAVTNLDLHDIARICRTFGVGRFYVVTPVDEQQKIVAQIVRHWQEGYGAVHNPDRREAFARVETVPDLRTAQRSWSERQGGEAQVVTTSARAGTMSHAECRQRLDAAPLLLVLGTGSGLAPEVTDCGWPALEPVCGVEDYNHLPVRAAAAIILDRLFTAR